MLLVVAFGTDRTQADTDEIPLHSLSNNIRSKEEYHQHPGKMLEIRILPPQIQYHAKQHKPNQVSLKNVRKFLSSPLHPLRRKQMENRI